MNNLATIGQCMGSLQQNMSAISARMTNVLAEMNDQKDTLEDLSTRVSKLEAYIQEMEKSLSVAASAVDTSIFPQPDPVQQPLHVAEGDDIELIPKKKKSVTKKVTIANA